MHLFPVCVNSVFYIAVQAHTKTMAALWQLHGPIHDNWCHFFLCGLIQIQQQHLLGLAALKDVIKTHICVIVTTLLY